MKHKSALIVIDFINDIVHLEGKMPAYAAFMVKHRVIEHANQAIAIARAAQLPIIFVKVGFTEGYPECADHSYVFAAAKENNILQLGSWGTEYHPQLDFQNRDLSIVKHRVSAFYNTDLELILRSQNVNTVILCGVSTAMTIDHTARDAQDRDYRVIVLEDACGAENLENHHAALMMVKKVSQVLKTQDLTKELL